MDDDDPSPAVKRLLGAHMPTAGGLANSLYAGKEIGCTAVQLFTSSPRQWQHTPLSDETIAGFKQAKSKTGIAFTCAHDSYLINLAAYDHTVLERSQRAFLGELQRAHELEIPWVVTHMGAYLDMTLEAGQQKLISSLKRLLEETSDLTAGIALETTAGQGTGLGYRFDQIAEVLEGVGPHPRLGVCLDTCHVFVAGYDIRTPEGFDQVIQEFDKTIGLHRLMVIHANDAKKSLGSRVDRHEHIGEGEIGVEAFSLLVNDPRLLSIPIILETPDADKMHAVNLAKLQRLAAAATMGMHIHVRLFGHYSESDQNDQELAVPSGLSVQKLTDILAERDPNLRDMASICRVAINEEYASLDTTLKEGDVVAFVPPMSGG